jgi:hypothetical protein
MGESWPIRKMRHDGEAGFLCGGKKLRQRRYVSVVCACQLWVEADRCHDRMLTYPEEVLERVTLFCDKYGVEVPSMDGNVPYGKSTWYACAKSEKKW